jgi:hypothetical protein
MSQFSGNGVYQGRSKVRRCCCRSKCQWFSKYSIARRTISQRASQAVSVENQRKWSEKKMPNEITTHIAGRSYPPKVSQRFFAAPGDRSNQSPEVLRETARAVDVAGRQASCLITRLRGLRRDATVSLPALRRPFRSPDCNQRSKLLLVHRRSPSSCRRIHSLWLLLNKSWFCGIISNVDS